MQKHISNSLRPSATEQVPVLDAPASISLDSVPDGAGAIARSNFTRDSAQDHYAFASTAPVDWIVEPGLTPYTDALHRMEQLAEEIRQGQSNETVWLVEHPAIYTAGTSAKRSDLLNDNGFGVYETGRGGQYTYHGPGQRIAYVMLDLNRRKRDVRGFVGMLEQWIIDTLGEFNVAGERREERVGVWVKRPEKPRLDDGSVHEDKIAALGIRLRKWVSFHGLAINVEPDLSHYGGIVPCGVRGHGVTSLVDLGLPVSMDDLDHALKRNFADLFCKRK